MRREYLALCVAAAVATIGFARPLTAEVRTWADSTGTHKVEAEFLGVTDGKVRLRREDGKEVAIALDRLSSTDRDFVRKAVAKKSASTAKKPTAGPKKPALTAKAQSTTDSPSGAILAIAEKFYADLRTTEREQARAALTATALELAKEGSSSLASLPTPDEHDKAIRPGKVKIDGTQAEVPVQVRVDGESQKTTLHLRNEGDQWRVFALSATLGDQEQTINFETPLPKADGAQPADPLQSLVGKELPLEGVLLDGTPLDMSRFAGKVVLIDFWATWCGPCREEIPNILANWRQYHESGFEVIAISVDQDLGALQKFVAQEQPPWTVVADHHPANRSHMGDRYGIRGIPAFILLGKDGKVASVDCRGPQLGKQLAELLGSQNNAVAQD